MQLQMVGVEEEEEDAEEVPAESTEKEAEETADTEEKGSPKRPHSSDDEGIFLITGQQIAIDTEVQGGAYTVL